MNIICISMKVYLKLFFLKKCVIFVNKLIELKISFCIYFYDYIGRFLDNI